MGYTNVRDYEGGKEDWMDAGHPVESAHSHDKSKSRDSGD
jgi:hypothetical protein